MSVALMSKIRFFGAGAYERGQLKFYFETGILVTACCHQNSRRFIYFLRLLLPLQFDKHRLNLIDLFHTTVTPLRTFILSNCRAESVLLFCVNIRLNYTHTVMI